MSPPYKKLRPLISAFIKNSIFGNNRDPWTVETVETEETVQTVETVKK